MPRGPKGEKRPADVIGAAILIGRLATGEAEESGVTKSAAAELGSKGGKARATSLSKKRRSEIAKKAAKSRWNKGF
ncbi:MAG: RNA-binding protein [Bauldia sp.]